MVNENGDQGRGVELSRSWMYMLRGVLESNVDETVPGETVHTVSMTPVSPRWRIDSRERVPAVPPGHRMPRSNASTRSVAVYSVAADLGHRG